MLKTALLIISILLFTLNYLICQMFYPYSDEDSLIKWNDLNDGINHVIILLLLINLQILIKKHPSILINKWYQLVLYVGIGFTSSDVIDRFVFRTRDFALISDSIMIAVVLITGYRKYLINKIK